MNSQNKNSQKFYVCYVWRTAAMIKIRELLHNEGMTTYQTYVMMRN